MARKKKQTQDEAHEETDRIIEETERKIHKEYKQAEKELKQKVEAFFEKFDAEDEEKRQQLANGEITADYYRKWRTTRMATGQRWEDMRQIIAEDMTNANNLARSTINGHAADVYAMNRNFATYQVEKEARINTSFTLYNRRAVERLMVNDERLLPLPTEGSRAWQAMMNKDLRWNQQKINSSLIQGILQGDSIPELSERLLSIVGNNEVSARRSARTMMTSVENKARDDSYEELKSKGVELETIWLATLDDRTRHSHRQLHGEVRGEDGKYSNGLRYPADPAGAPEEVYNCRCCEISHVKGHPIDIPKWSEKWDDDMTFEKWLGEHEENVPVEIKQEAKEWDALKYLNDNNIDLSYLKDYMPYDEYRTLYDEISDSALPNGEPAQEYFKKLLDGTYQNDKIVGMLNDLTNEEMLSDKGYAFLDKVQQWNIDAIPLTKLDAPKSFEEFVNDVGGGDLTKGSCASLSYCYAANHAGYDIRDFRGGDSRFFFSKSGNMDTMAELKGVVSLQEFTKKPINTAVKLLKEMPMDTPHILGVGKHAAVVKRTEDGYRYLELQAASGNGWYKLTTNELARRFGATKTSKWGENVDLIEVDSLSKNQYFIRLMAYINTDEGSQQKGEGGGRK